MANDDVIRGKNLFVSPEFSGDWASYWTVTGSHQVLQDDETGKRYLKIVNGATAKCSVELPVRPDADARYWFSFLYEAVYSGVNKVTIQKEDGEVIFDESFVTRKGLENPAADEVPFAAFRPYEPVALQRLERSDTRIDLTVTAASGGTRNGILITGFDMDLRLAPLEAEVLLDGRPQTAVSQQAVS